MVERKRNEFISGSDMSYRPCLVTIRIANATSVDVKEEIHKAVFHGWITDSPIGEEIVGLVEYEDGTIHTPLMNQIRFVDDMVNEIFSPNRKESKCITYSPTIRIDGPVTEISREALEKIIESAFEEITGECSAGLHKGER